MENSYKFIGNMVAIDVYYKDTKHVCLINRSDFQRVKRYKRWYAVKATTTMYCCTHHKGRTVQMHRLLLGNPEGLVVDHKDRNGLNNTRSNIRAVTRSQNNANRGVHKNSKTGIQGVSPTKSGTWHVYLARNKEIVIRKDCKDLTEAVMLYVSNRNQYDHRDDYIRKPLQL